MMENKKTEQNWLKENRLLKSNAKGETIQNSVWVDRGWETVKKQVEYRVYNISETRETKNEFERAAIFFYLRLYSHCNKKSDYGTGNTWYLSKRNTKNWFPQRFFLHFKNFKTHFLGKGKLLGLTFPERTTWLRVDLDDHGKNNRSKFKNDFIKLYKYFCKNEINGSKWFVELKEDLTGCHFDFFFPESNILLKDGHEILNKALAKLDIKCEIYPQNKTNCKLFGDNQYKLILDKVYNMDLIKLHEFMIEDQEYYEHCDINYVKDHFNFDWFLDENKEEIKEEIKEVVKNVQELQRQDNDSVKNDGRKYKGVCKKRLNNFLNGRVEHGINELNEICCIVSKISLMQGFDESVIVEKLLNRLNKINLNKINGRISNFFNKTEQQKRKQIEGIVKQSKKDKNEKLLEVALFFKERNINFLEENFEKTERGIKEGSIHLYNVSAFLTENQFSKDFNDILIDKVKPLLPRKMYYKLQELVIHLGVFCKNQALQQKPVSYKNFRSYLKENFNWEPRTDKLLINLIKTLISIKVIKKYKIEKQTYKQIFYFDIGSVLSQEVNIPETFLKSVLFLNPTSAELETYLGIDFPYINP